MTQARLVHGFPDPGESRVFLQHARELAADAGVAGLRATSRQLLLYQACIAACDAALAAVGLTVEGDEGGHVLRITEAGRVLDLDSTVLDELQVARQVRAGSAYRAALVTEDQLLETSEAAQLLLDEVGRFVSDA